MQSRNYIPEGLIIRVIVNRQEPSNSAGLLELEVECVGMDFSKLAIRIPYVVDHQTRRSKWTVK